MDPYWACTAEGVTRSVLRMYGEMAGDAAASGRWALAPKQVQVSLGRIRPSAASAAPATMDTGTCPFRRQQSSVVHDDWV
jgi:hypothetical protein